MYIGLWNEEKQERNAALSEPGDEFVKRTVGHAQLLLQPHLPARDAAFGDVVDVGQEMLPLAMW